jgi:hypothetical protein
MGKIDRKFRFVAVNPANGKVYTEDNALILCAKDAAVPAALEAYNNKCVDLGAEPSHIVSIELLIDRVVSFQKEQGGGRVPDTTGEELERCLGGESSVGLPALVSNKRPFAVEDEVIVYDRYRFAIPLKAVVRELSGSNDGVRVELKESNSGAWPVGSDSVWVSEMQLRRS